MRAEIVIALCAASIGTAQSPTFEVAAVRPSTHKAQNLPPLLAKIPAIGEMHGGPGTSEPEFFVCTGVSLLHLVRIAFGLQVRQISAPAWFDSAIFDINAKLSPDTTQDQFRIMFQNLLAERFGLKFHYETQDFPAYDLLVAKNGPKLKPSSTAHGIAMQWNDGRMLVSFQSYSMGDLAKWLSGRLADVSDRDRYQIYAASSVVNKTGLESVFDFTLDFVGSPGPGGGLRQPELSTSGRDSGSVSLLVALERQIGLKIEQRKEPLPVLVIDHAERTSAEN